MKIIKGLELVSDALDTLVITMHSVKMHRSLQPCDEDNGPPVLCHVKVQEKCHRGLDRI